MEAADGWLALLSSRARIVAGGAVGVAALVLFAYCQGKSAGETAERLKIDHARTEQAMQARAEIAPHAAAAVVAARAAVAKLTPAHDAARIVDSTHVAVLRRAPAQTPAIPDLTATVALGIPADSIVAVPVEVVRRMVLDSLAIFKLSVAVDSLERLARADSAAIQALEAENADLRRAKAPRCGRKCGVVIGAAATAGGAYLLGHVGDVLDAFGRLFGR